MRNTDLLNYNFQSFPEIKNLLSVFEFIIIYV
jgi:hypothetical protein